MNRKLIIYIIILTTIALIGLVGIQLYWIKNAIVLKESTFKRSVNEAVSNTIYKLAEIEKANIYKRQMNYYKQGSIIFEELNPSSKQIISDSLSGNAQGQNGITSSRHTDTLTQKQIDALNKGFAGIMQHSLQSNLFDGLFDLGLYRPVEKRINEIILDSLLSFEFLKKGINTKYEYGVFCPVRNLLVFQKTGNFLKELIEKSFVFYLFPDDTHLNPNYLILYFPNERSFLLTQMWGMLLISVVLIITIILSFFYTIYTIIRQKKLSEMKNDFINNMTHEFKTPVSTISLACEALADKGLKKSETLYENYINIIIEENNRLGNMAEKILQSAILEKDHVTLKFEKIDIHDILTDVIKNINMQVEIKDGVINTDFNASSSVLNTDKVHLSNVFINLIDNANKYSPKKPDISILTENVKGGIIVYIKDQGLGICKVDQKKIFDKLYRVHTGDIHDIKGFGLGLSYVKIIIEELGGSICLESELGQGTTFRVFLPIGND
ncbi:MAG: HAMP domain-containing histidine kinase [Bacteroidales bacterium]|nr:HAMP domain-containing histidine kinase [Bacteroidales bacterium]